MLTACASAALAAWLAPATAAAQGGVTPEDQEKIEAAIPSRAPVIPRKPRKLLIFDVNVNYGGHGSIRTANTAFTLMGRKTGAFDTVISKDPAIFKPDSLRQFDAVFFNNTVGNCFEDPALRQSLVEFVYGGGGLMGVHGTSVAFTKWPGAIEDWPEFGCMLGARGANHRASDERVFIKLDEPDHPVNQAFGGHGFEYRDEFFRVHDPYSRKRVRVLLSIDTEKTDLKQGPAYGKLERDDNDFALAWVRNYGRGRVFYCTIAHNPYVFWDPRMLSFYLAAAQFALGDLPAPTIPSARLTPALRAQEKLGWRLGIEAYTFHKYTLFEAIEKTAQLGLPFMGGPEFPAGEQGHPQEPRAGPFRRRAAPDPAEARRCRGAAADLLHPRHPRRRSRLPAHLRVRAEARHRDLHERAEAGGAGHDREILRPLRPPGGPAQPRPEGLSPLLESRRHPEGMPGPQSASRRLRGPGLLDARGPGSDRGVRQLKDRLLTVQMHDLHERSAEGHDVPWGTGAGQTESLLREIHRLGIRPTMFGLEYSSNWLGSMPEIARCIEFFNRVSLQLAKRGEP